MSLTTTSTPRKLLCKNCTLQFRTKAALNRHKMVNHKRKNSIIPEKTSMKMKSKSTRQTRSMTMANNVKQINISEEAGEKKSGDDTTYDKNKGKGVSKAGKRRIKIFKCPN